MKNILSFRLLFIATLGSAAMLLASCAKSDRAQSSAQGTKAAAKEVVADIKDAAADSWDRIKDYTFEKRDDFAASLERMTGKRDDSVREMNAKLTGLPDDAAKERDRASKEFNKASSELKSQLADLRAGTADTWAATKEKVAQSWQRVQAAYDKLTTSSPS